MTTLVGYATAQGSTRGVAERIAAILTAAGSEVDLLASSDMRSAHGYDTVVLGSAIHNGQWLPDATAAVERLDLPAHQCAVWAFSVSSVGATSTTLSPRVARYLRRVMPEPDAVQMLRTHTELRDHRFFVGAIAPGDWPGFGRIVFRLMGGRYGDARDWHDIDTWARTIGGEITDNRH
jgi:menaquinone-dependent protoporphyrinogen oxidase